MNRVDLCMSNPTLLKGISASCVALVANSLDGMYGDASSADAICSLSE